MYLIVNMNMPINIVRNSYFLFSLYLIDISMNIVIDNYFHSSSLSEKHFERMSRSDPIGLIKQTEKSLLRMYPDGLRQDSSNPNPINAWNFGIQMVALNYQHDDQMMELCYGKFLDNGACGYVLKPNYLIDIEKSKFNPFDYLTKSISNYISKDILEYPQRLILTIISGQFFSRSNETTDDIPDPYVVISTHGIYSDQQIQKTKFIENNGFNPIWNETFIFDILFPQMCLVCFDIYDYDVFTHDDRLAYFCLPMTTMQTGLFFF
jgi:phosphatidylinositol phospholipase C delta